MAGRESFFGDEEVEDVAQSHIEQIVSLEEREAKRIMALYKRVRHDLRDRLEMLEPGTFTAQKTRGALLQVEMALAEMKRTLGNEMRTSGNEAAEKGVEHLIRELEKWNKHFTGAVIPINLDAVAVASNVSNFLFNRYETSLSAYSEALRAQFAYAITEGSIQQISSGEMVQRIGRVFMGEEWRLHRLVRTELHNVYSQGKLRGMTDLVENEIPDLKKGLFHPRDSRTGDDSKHADNLNLVVPVNEPFRYKWKGKERVFMSPPDRPLDRSIMIPVRDAWLE